MIGSGLVNFSKIARGEVGPYWMIWLGLSCLALLFTGLWRVSDAKPRPALVQRDYVPLLGVSALTSFIGSLLAQLIFVGLRRPAIDAATGNLQLGAGNLVAMGLIANLVGWIVGVSLIRGGRAITVIGYQLHRIAAGVCDGFLGICIAMPFVAVALIATEHIWSRYSTEKPAKHELLQVLNETHSVWIRVGVTLAAAVAAPLFEELLFRGFVQGVLRRLTGSRWIAVASASAMFAALHDRWTIPPIFVLSMFLGFAYERKQNLWTSTAMHAMFNAFNLITSGSN